jgi:GNAT superfamily N-acetyltransferase
MSGWTVERVGQVREFSALAGPLLHRQPIEANVMLTWMEGVLAGRTPDPGDTWLLLRRHGEPAAAAFRTPDFPLFLTAMPEPAVQALALWWHRHDPGLDQASGALGPVTAFAGQWRELTGLAVRTVMAERMHALTALQPPAGVSGVARRAGPQDVELCIDWSIAFGAEAGTLTTPEQARTTVPRRVSAGTLWLWVDGALPVALAGNHPAVAGVARIGPVYTPPQHRNHGYGSAITAAATAAVLAAGAGRAMLYTDLANPVSNAIYARLGYRPAGDAAIVAFEPAG